MSVPPQPNSEILERRNIGRGGFEESFAYKTEDESRVISGELQWEGLTQSASLARLD